jgi:hypothetical protein
MAPHCVTPHHAEIQACGTEVGPAVACCRVVLLVDGWSSLILLIVVAYVPCTHIFHPANPTPPSSRRPSHTPPITHTHTHTHTHSTQNKAGMSGRGGRDRSRERGGGGGGSGGGGGRRGGGGGARGEKTQYDETEEVEFTVSNEVEVVPDFETMGLRQELLRGIYDYGFEKPSAIQQRAVLPIIKGYDVIAQSQSGTGKTAVFSMGILQRLDTASNDTQALVLSPTRELAEQTQKVILSLGDYMNVQCHACIGGKSIGEDIRRLDYGVQVVSGTPGRVFDMIRRRNLKTRNLKMLVRACGLGGVWLVGRARRQGWLLAIAVCSLKTPTIHIRAYQVIDEADEMLNKGFKEQIYDIYRCVVEGRRACHEGIHTCLRTPPVHPHPHAHAHCMAATSPRRRRWC